MNPRENEPLRLIPTQHVPEHAPDVGSALRAARERKGQTIEGVAQITRIPRKYLDALENNRLEEFPALAYLRGFLRSYCDHLEVEFEPLWKQVVPEKTAALGADADSSESAKDRSPNTAAAPAASSPSTRVPWLALAAGAALALAAALLALAGRRSERADSPEPPPPPAALRPIAGPRDVQLVVELREQAFLTVLVDGRRRFEGRAPKNARQEWRATEWVGLRCSRPEELRLTLNGRELRAPAPDRTGLLRIEAP